MGRDSLVREGIVHENLNTRISMENRAVLQAFRGQGLDLTLATLGIQMK